MLEARADVDSCEHGVWCGGGGERFIDICGQCGTLFEAVSKNGVTVWVVRGVKQNPSHLCPLTHIKKGRNNLPIFCHAK